MILLLFFFFNDTATTEIYTLSLHDALPISAHRRAAPGGRRRRRVRPRVPERIRRAAQPAGGLWLPRDAGRPDRKSTRLKSSHANISYAVLCLKKKKKPLLR